MRRLILLLVLIHIYSCNGSTENANSRELNPIENETPKSIIIQPLGKIPSAYISYIQKELYRLNKYVVVENSTPLPTSCFYKTRNRYRADSLIKFLQKRATKDQIIVGITIKDISHTKGKIEDYGIMGLGFVNGNSCIASSFRLASNNRMEQLLKLVLHEIGHTEGLRHCEIRSCFMRDCGGKNHWDEETGFCKNCKGVLTKKAWSFSNK